MYIFAALLEHHLLFVLYIPLTINIYQVIKARTGVVVHFYHELSQGRMWCTSKVVSLCGPWGHDSFMESTLFYSTFNIQHYSQWYFVFTFPFLYFLYKLSFPEYMRWYPRRKQTKGNKRKKRCFFFILWEYNKLPGNGFPALFLLVTFMMRKEYGDVYSRSPCHNLFPKLHLFGQEKGSYIWARKKDKRCICEEWYCCEYKYSLNHRYKILNTT